MKQSSFSGLTDFGIFGINELRDLEKNMGGFTNNRTWGWGEGLIDFGTPVLPHIFFFCSCHMLLRISVRQ